MTILQDYRRVAQGVVFCMVCCLLVMGACVPTAAQQGKLPPGSFGQNVEVVGYTDLEGHPVFKQFIQEVKGRWLLYMGDFWERGWIIADVTDPKAVKLVKYVNGPYNTSTVQVDWAEGDRMETPLSAVEGGRDFDRNKPYEGGFYIWDLRDPLNPEILGQWKSPGTHRNYYDGGRYVYATTQWEGYQGQFLAIVDVSDGAHPKEVGRWWVPGQYVGGGEKPLSTPVSLHGPSVPIGNLLYLPYGAAGLVILDISDVSKPQLVGQLKYTPPFQNGLAVHTVVVVPDRHIAITNSEASTGCTVPPDQASIVNIADPKNPHVISFFPRPVVPPGYPLPDFCSEGARTGPHNQGNTLQWSHFVQKQGDIVYLSYFSAGLQIYNISDPREPRIVGYFIPPNPVKRYGLKAVPSLVTSTEDALVDTRGYIYITDGNQGVWILRYTGPGQPAPTAK